MDVNQKALLELLKASLFGSAPSFPEGVEWDKVLEEAKAQTVVSLAASAVPLEEAKKWDVFAAQNVAHFMRVLYEQTNLINLFASHDLPLVILKGAAAAVYYPVPARRTMGDIDFLVPPARFDEAKRLMEENGYQFRFDYGDGRDYGFLKGGVILELHRRYSDSDWDIESVVLEGLTRAEERQINGRTFPALPDAVNGLVLLEHVRHHMLGGLGLRHVTDWMMYVHAVLTDAFWEESFCPLAREAGLDRFARVMTKMCRLWLGLPDDITWCDDADEETALELLENVLQKGNFGRKDPYVYRPVESIAVAVREEGLFHFLQKTGLSCWKAAQKHAFLRPFAWLYQIFRFAGKGIRALLRGTNFKKDLADGAEKSDFYERLDIAQSKKQR